jgi:hypothetical protein
MDILQTIALLCQINGAGSDSAHVTIYTQKLQLECQQYYVKCLDPLNTNYKTLSKCIRDKK